jgi:heme A synthase
MYVIAIGWLYVTLLMAATEANLTAGVLTFGFYGLAPLALFLWLFGTPQRRRNQAAAQKKEPDPTRTALDKDR